MTGSYLYLHHQQCHNWPIWKVDNSLTSAPVSPLPHHTQREKQHQCWTVNFHTAYWKFVKSEHSVSAERQKHSRGGNDVPHWAAFRTEIWVFHRGAFCCHVWWKSLSCPFIAEDEDAPPLAPVWCYANELCIFYRLNKHDVRPVATALYCSCANWIKDKNGIPSAANSTISSRCQSPVDEVWLTAVASSLLRQFSRRQGALTMASNLKGEVEVVKVQKA